MPRNLAVVVTTPFCGPGPLSPPLTITTTCCINRSYAQLVGAYLRDISTQLDSRSPLYIIELGSGSGRFSHAMLQGLVENEEVI